MIVATPSRLSAVAAGDSLFRQITDRLAIAIISGTYAEGEVIPNEDGFDHGLSVSRTAFREALKYLSAKGLIEARPRSGTRVAPRASWNLLDPDILRWSLEADANERFIADLFELRLQLEPSVAGLAAIRRGAQHLLRIEDALLTMERLEPYTEASIAADVAFHEAIFDACGNTAMSCLKKVVSTTLFWAMRLQQGRDHGTFRRSLHDHRRIYQAIVDGDSEFAKALTRVLVTQACSDTLEHCRERAATAARRREAR